ncbi:tape measure protein [Desulfocurvibacter africanus]|uniref:tape measure protein n=1 Tax=Desulfocurvibacter africanus TaxID=873 RepID=UPI0004216E4D|nr:tape measure protein [Desulfocurvibacter africanus]
MAKESKFEFKIAALDQFSRTFEAFNQRMDSALGPVRRLRAELGQLGVQSGLGKLTASLGEVGNRMGNVVGQVAATGAKLGVLLGGAGYLFKTQLVDVASEFQNFRAVLTTLEGDQGKARKSMEWIQEFTAKTPYQLAEVTDAFVKLRSFGLDPKSGMLKTLGDTASAMNKPIDQVVEAMSDAVMGENERLKELGITASKQGEWIIYNYTNKVGKQVQKAARASNRDAIQGTIESIWNEKFAGAMDDRSKGWSGMVSNLMDSWTNFRNMIMDAGVFDWLQNKLRGLLDQIQAMTESGNLKELAEDIGKRIVAAFEAMEQGVKSAWASLQKFWSFIGPIVDALGPMNVILGTIAAVIFGPLLASIALLIPAVYALGAAIMTTPIGWIIGGLALVGAAAVALWKNWDDLMNGIKEGIVALTGWMPDWLKDKLGLSGHISGSVDESQSDKNAFYTQRKILGQTAAGNIESAREYDRQQRSIQETRSLSVQRQEAKVIVDVRGQPGTRTRVEGTKGMDLAVHNGVTMYGR